MIPEGPYDPLKTEPTLYDAWERSGYFNPDNLPRAKGKRAKKYIVYMPLPNVTGTLHMGHLLNNTIQDILVRYHRLRGFRALYLPGTDHAGIATQYVVEKELKKQGTNRFVLGREEFIKKVWEWKEQYGNLIYAQLRKIGISADWSRTRFTMDPTYAKDVTNAFIAYHKKGLIYRGVRTVNWCPRCQTSLSELELEYKEEPATLYYMQYGSFTVATVRPETKFGDTALAVNPRDARYKQYVGKTLQIESISTEGTLETPMRATITLKIVADNAVDSKFGTGVIKVTPAHDSVDFQIAERHTLPLIQIIDERGKMNERTGKYAGMNVIDARKKVVDDLKALGLITKEEAYTHRVAICYRCAHVIEPIPSAQWFLKMNTLAKSALQAVTKKKTSIFPSRFEKVYKDWLAHIHDWTISRQIWWGHQLPVWFCAHNKEDKNKKELFVVANKKPVRCPFCKKCTMEQSPDVLDTWFSSALWPFAGLSKNDLNNYYPGSALITARDILNLWVARMIFSGLSTMKKVPFARVFIHGTVLAKDGRRMSKSLGTGIDPLMYINKNGADATRFAVIWQMGGQDIRWDEAAVIAGQKFCNKIWNAARFIQIRTDATLSTKKTSVPRAKTSADKKILSALTKTKKSVARDIESFAFSKALHTLYDFFWHDFCDIYLEISKHQLDDVKLVQNTRTILSSTLLQFLKLLHPFMPFVTEAIYQELPGKKKRFLMIEEL